MSCRSPGARTSAPCGEAPCLSGALPSKAQAVLLPGSQLWPQPLGTWHGALPWRRQTKTATLGKCECDFPWTKHSHKSLERKRYQHSRFRVIPQKPLFLFLEDSRNRNNPGQEADIFVGGGYFYVERVLNFYMILKESWPRKKYLVLRLFSKIYKVSISSRYSKEGELPAQPLTMQFWVLFGKAKRAP